MSAETVEQHPDEVEGDVAAAPEEIVQPADAVEDDGGKVIELHSRNGAGSLTLRPGQVNLDTHQKAALVAIGIDINHDPGVRDHVRPFMHMCQVRGLDPWAREAYLIGRGKGSNRKWTMQTGIDGYRKMAASTGRFIRVKDTLWTGPDDDDRSYWRDERGVMRRVWWDQWPASRGNPGAAKVVIEHYDTAGEVVTTEAVADWEFYAPYNDVWEGPQGSRRRKVDADGKPVRELTDMWIKGGPFMLAKCAEALADRKAFPATMNGIYVTEEMHRADVEERATVTAVQREKRALARAEAMAVTVEEPAAEQSEPTPVGEVAQDIVDAITVEEPEDDSPEPAPATDKPVEDDQMLDDYLRAELAWQAAVVDKPVAALTRRAVAAARKNIEDFTTDELLRTVVGLRPMVTTALRTAERTEDADTYERTSPEHAVDVAQFGG